MEIRKDQITLGSIARDVSPVAAAEGSCYDIQNLRPKDGAWRPIREKHIKHKYTLPAAYSHVIKVYGHDSLPGDEYIMHVKKDTSGKYYVLHVRIVSSAATVLGVLKTMDPPSTGEQLYDIAWMDNILVVSTSLKTTFHVYRDGAYVINNSLSSLPGIELIAKEGDKYTSSGVFGGNISMTKKDSLGAAITEYLQVKNKAEEEGYYASGVFYIAAYRMKDGTYIKHGNPVYVSTPYSYTQSIMSNLNDKLKLLWRWYFPNPYPDGPAVSEVRFDNIRFAKQLVRVGLEASLPEGWDSVIDSICVFATSPRDLYEIPDSFGAYKHVSSSLHGGIRGGYYDIVYSPPLVNIGAEFGDMLFYKIKEYSVSGGFSPVEEEVSFKNIVTNEVLPPDDMSHHGMSPRRMITYNGRLHMANIRQDLYEGHRLFISGMDDEYAKYVTGMNDASVGVVNDPLYNIVVNVDTVGSKGLVAKNISAPTQSILSPGPGGTTVFSVLPPILTYPHPNATSIDLYLGSSPYIRIFRKELTRHRFYSFSYAKNEFKGISLKPMTIGVDPGVFSGSPEHFPQLDNLPEQVRKIYDPNRLQVSKPLNPFAYPSINSYQIGEDDANAINDIGVQASPVSEGQFGQYPVILFSAKGITILEQGSGDVLYQSQRWLSSVVANRGVLGVDGGIIFTTKDGLYIIQGRQVRELSRKLISNQTYSVKTEMEMPAPIDDTPDLLTDALQDTHFLWDSLHNEIVIGNKNTAYHIRYSPAHDSFYRASVGYESGFLKGGVFHAVYSDATFQYIADMSSDKSSQQSVEVYFATNPVTHKSMTLKKLYQAQLQCYAIIPGITGRGMFRIYGSNYKSIPIGESDIKTEYDRIQEYISNVGSLPGAFMTDTGLYTTDEGGLGTDTVYIFAMTPGEDIRPMHDVNVVTGRSPQSVIYFVYKYSGVVHPNSAINSIITAISDRFSRRMR